MIAGDLDRTLCKRVSPDAFGPDVADLAEDQLDVFLVKLASEGARLDPGAAVGAIDGPEGMEGREMLASPRGAFLGDLERDERPEIALAGGL